jgi:hypothetical protein
VLKHCFAEDPVQCSDIFNVVVTCNHTSRVKLQFTKRCKEDSLSILHKMHRLGPAQPRLWRLSQTRILFSVNNQMNNLIFKGQFHFHRRVHQVSSRFFQTTSVIAWYTFLTEIFPVLSPPVQMRVSDRSCRRIPAPMRFCL